MINRENNPIEWSQLMYELEDAHEHLGKLIEEMNTRGNLDIESYSTDIAHIYAHLNRAWNLRDFHGEMSEQQQEQFRNFPKDIEPIA